MQQSRKVQSAVLALAMLAFAACSDDSSPSAPALSPEAARAEVESQGEGAAALRRYVAIGTSVSMGYQSDGVNATGQDQSWPAQLARLGGTTLRLPSIAGFGCKAPMAAPLARGVRISGEAITLGDSLLNCDPNVAGIELPAANVAIAGATTFDALYSTPQNVTSVLGAKVYSRVLPSNTTQLRAALAQKPKLISIELGANEVLGSRSGIAIPGVTIVPVNTWAPLYTAVVDSAVRQTKRVVLVGLIKDAASFPSFRRGDEIYADAPTLLAAFHVAVSSDCAGSQNLIFVPVRIPTAISIGAFYRSKGLPPYSFSCANVNNGAPDYVLTPAEAAVVNSTLGEMNARIRIMASRRGLAHFELEALYGLPGLKPPFSSVQLMTSSQPYGAYFSLDGIHPNAAGHAILADAAAKALNARFGLGIPTASSVIASR
ncbi:MAG TPA: SGNH/GDSL hydrolase family protein [Gemmatimonadaceae bacterium]|nr:SGNH/GDSL hydrolase family protein [Gemmatimonadaceae bacterium]HPV74153.1 SGNH/GDSL hydrolase family protein [Gemmatimonadaceae bacterium]